MPFAVGQAATVSPIEPSGIDGLCVTGRLGWTRPPRVGARHPAFEV
jgi:hypothetical protein